MEYVRLLASGNKNHPRYAEAEAEYQKSVSEYTNLKSQYNQIIPIMEDAHKTISEHLNKENYLQKDLITIKTEDKKLYKWINRALDDLEENAFCGIRIQKRLIPKVDK